MISRRLLRIKCLKSLYAHVQSDSESIIAAEKDLLFSIKKSYDLYHLLLRLVVDVSDHVESVIEQKKLKLRPTEEELNPSYNFVHNRVISQLKYSPALNRYLVKNDLGWEGSPDLIKKITANMMERDYYTSYMQIENPTYEDDKTLVMKFLKREIEDFDYIYEVLSDMSILWVDEIEFITVNVIKTVKDMRASQVLDEDSEDIKLLPIYRDNTDVDFVKRLLNSSILSFRDNMLYIDSFTQNWDLERIAFMDRLLMLMALTEFSEFKNIPVSVTMNEYIDLAKMYSTPQSSTFVNGVLDKMVKDLETKGKLTKTK